MTKTELQNQLKQTTKTLFITKRGLADILGIKDAKGVNKYLAGLERVDGKYYFIPDVAEALMKSCYKTA